MNTNEVSKLVGKKIAQVIDIEAVGGKDDFAITHAYEKKVSELGYNIGWMCGDLPRALAKNMDIAKWYNIPESHYHLMEGVVLCDDGRNGSSAKIVIFA